MNEIWQRKEIESPCVQVCVIHRDSGLCMGCYRTTSEIAGWSRLDPEARKALMATLPDRAPQVRGKRRGGRKTRK